MGARDVGTFINGLPIDHTIIHCHGVPEGGLVYPNRTRPADVFGLIEDSGLMEDCPQHTYSADNCGPIDTALSDPRITF